MSCQRAGVASLASAWVYMMTLVRGPSMQDAKRKARLHADKTIVTLQEHETELQNELRTLANAARQAQKQVASQSLRAVLAKSKATRQQLTLLVKKRQALQNHLDTLKNSELNEQVLSSVKQTSSVLKTMGLEQSLSDMDAVVADMQDAQSDLSALQEGLSEGFSGQGDEDDLDQELEMLLSDSDATLPMPAARTHALPMPTNSMHGAPVLSTTTSATAVPTAAPTAVASAAPTAAPTAAPKKSKKAKKAQTASSTALDPISEAERTEHAAEHAVEEESENIVDTDTESSEPTTAMEEAAMQAPNA